MKSNTKMLPSLFAICLCAMLYGNLCAAILLPKTDYTLTVIAGENTYVYAYPEIDLYKGGLYLKDLDGAIDRIYRDTFVSPTDATVSFMPRSANKFTITSEVCGKKIDKSHLYHTISTALQSKTEEITVPLKSISPTITKEFLCAHTNCRAEFKTFYGSSLSGRKHNIQLCAEMLNGKVVESGESFSFNAAVGERTYERGFTTAKVISEGRFIDGVGGGVCQVSSTIYNCVLLAGLDIEERHPHSLSVSYVEPSFDAMVSYGACDLKFKNTTDGPIFIECFADGSNITVRLYGKAMPHTVKRISKTLKTECPGMDVILDATGELCGELDEVVIFPSKHSIVSEGFLEFYEGEKLVKTKPLGRNSYGGVKGVLAKKAPKTQINEEL